MMTITQKAMAIGDALATEPAKVAEAVEQARKVARKIVLEIEKRSVACPKCGARRGRPCRASRIASPNSLGGGWGGPPDLDRSHVERREALLSMVANALIAEK